MSIGVYGLVYLSVGSLGISVYRLLYIKQELFVKYIIGENVLLILVLSFSLVLTGVATEFYMAQETGEKTGINMCTGLSANQARLFIEYKMSQDEIWNTTMYGEQIT